jgi:hypothetical protein
METSSCACMTVAKTGLTELFDFPSVLLFVRPVE